MKVTIQENQTTIFVSIDDVLTYTMTREGVTKNWHVRDMAGKLLAVDKYRNDLLGAIKAERLSEYSSSTESE